jgi:hypothetical protein
VEVDAVGKGGSIADGRGAGERGALDGSRNRFREDSGGARRSVAVRGCVDAGSSSRTWYVLYLSTEGVAAKEEPGVGADFSFLPLFPSISSSGHRPSLVHGVDMDHIVAIDNVTRNLVSMGQLPVTVGLFFSLGHSSIVIGMTIAIIIAVSNIDKLPDISNIGGVIGKLFWQVRGSRDTDCSFLPSQVFAFPLRSSSFLVRTLPSILFQPLLTSVPALLAVINSVVLWQSIRLTKRRVRFVPFSVFLLILTLVYV